MAYTVAAIRPCTYCGTPTARRRERTREPMCGSCGEERYVTAARERKAPHTESRRLWLEGQIRWAENGGIERAQAGALWRARMRKAIDRYRTELADWVSPVSQ